MRAALGEWRNWQTRRIQDPVGIALVGVRLPPRPPRLGLRPSRYPLPATSYPLPARTPRAAACALDALANRQLPIASTHNARRTTHDARRTTHSAASPPRYASPHGSRPWPGTPPRTARRWARRPTLQGEGPSGRARHPHRAGSRPRRVRHARRSRRPQRIPGGAGWRGGGPRRRRRGGAGARGRARRRGGRARLAPGGPADGEDRVRRRPAVDGDRRARDRARPDRALRHSAAARDDAGEIPIAVNRSVVGRSAAADVHLPDDDVSRQHALVWREAGAVWLVDLGSSNGTYVNGERVVDVIDLLDGDRLAFGAATFHLRIH